jgi:hypothetical protein
MQGLLPLIEYYFVAMHPQRLARYVIRRDATFLVVIGVTAATDGTEAELLGRD